MNCTGNDKPQQGNDRTMPRPTQRNEPSATPVPLLALRLLGRGAEARTERSEGPQRKRPRHTGLFLCHTCEHQGATK